MSVKFDVIQQGFLHFISFKSPMDETTITELSDYLKTTLSQSGLTIALDFQHIEAFPAKMFKEFVVLHRVIKAGGGRMVSLNVNSTLTQEIRSGGLESIFWIVKDVESLRTQGHEDKPKGKSLDANFINPFIEATKNIFSVQVGLVITPEKPFVLKSDNRPELVGEVLAGTLSIIGEHFKGNFCITIDSNSFFAIYQQMFKETLTSLNDDAKDALAELVNMIYGQAKTVLNDKNGYGIHPALPTVLAGNALRVFHSSTGPSICLPFKFEGGSFNIEISAEK